MGGATYNNYELSINPAMATVRNSKIFALSQSVKYEAKRVSMLDFSEVGGEEKKQKWRTNEDYQKTNMVILLVGEKISSELELTYSESVRNEKQIASAAGYKSKDNSISEGYGSTLNLAASWKWLGLGVTGFWPEIHYRGHSMNFGGGQPSRRFASRSTTRYKGYGGGLTFGVKSPFVFGVYHTTTSYTDRSRGANVDAEEEADRIRSDNDSDSFATSGAGFSYRAGNPRKNAFRFEMSTEVQKSDFIEDQTSTSRNTIALEAAVSGVLGGIRAHITKGLYLDNRYLSSMSFENNPESEEYGLDYDFFFSFSSDKGHSFGLYGSYVDKSGKGQFHGYEDADVDLILYTTSVTYSYYF